MILPSPRVLVRGPLAILVAVLVLVAGAATGLAVGMSIFALIE